MKKIFAVGTVFALVMAFGLFTADAGKPDKTVETKCTDGRDNDGDGLIDCQDPDCQPTADCIGGGANLVFTQGRFGEYCTDPSSWVRGGYQVGIWPTNVPFKAQAVDKNGYKVNATFNYSIATGSGIMDLADASDLVYQAAPPTPEGKAYPYTVTVDGVSASNSVYRDPATCDSCHSTPPGHIANSSTWGKCHDCHNLGVVMHTHAVQSARIGDTDCYACHPTGCYNTDAHNRLGLWCTDCHGMLSDVLNGTFKISGQAGKPLCADCHDREHSEPTRGVLYAESTMHGGMLCASCHNAPHRVEKPTMACTDCHTTQANDPKMGPDCGSCHKSNVDPHLVNTAK
ncbi:MAG TPA: hypothetical protein DCO77_06525 [Nitrospiraceae bacterium]|nr:hypothetical protein [Nitrospiraceae bacterium]